MSEVLSSTPSNPQTSEGANTQNRGRGRGRGGRGGRGTRGSRGGNRGRKTTTQTSSQRPNTRAKPKDDVSASNDHNYLFFWKPKGPHGWASQWHAESFTAKVTIPNKVSIRGSNDLPMNLMCIFLRTNPKMSCFKRPKTT